jgi:hypothetical protein
MGEQVAVDFLPDHVRALGPHAGTPQVGLELPVPGLNRPPLMPVKRELFLAGRLDSGRY